MKAPPVEKLVCDVEGVRGQKCDRCIGVDKFANHECGRDISTATPALRRELLAALLELRFPAWVEDIAGVCRFFNGRTEVESSIAREAVGALRGLRCEKIDCAGCGVVAKLRTQNDWDTVVLTPILAGTEDKGLCFRVLITCPLGLQAERDRDLINALLRGFSKLAATANATPQDDGLTPQQRAVYRLLQRGLSYKEMASALGVAHSTVRVQVATLRKLLGKSRVPVLRR